MREVEDRTWYTKADKVGIRQVFMPDVLPATLVATFVACCSCCIYGTVGAWLPLYLSTEKHWSTAEYSTFYVFWGLVGFFGLCAAGWLADKIGRRVGFIAPLIWGAVFMTLWVYAASNLWLWVRGTAWGFGFLGFWGPSTTLTAEVFPTRIRGVANGVVWFIGYFVGFVLWPFATVALQQATGSFALAFLTIPVFMAAMALGVWFIVPEHAGKELNAIARPALAAESGSRSSGCRSRHPAGASGVVRLPPPRYGTPSRRPATGCCRRNGRSACALALRSSRPSPLNRHSPDSRRLRGQDRAFDRLGKSKR